MLSLCWFFSEYIFTIDKCLFELNIQSDNLPATATETLLDGFQSCVRFGLIFGKPENQIDFWFSTQD